MCTTMRGFTWVTCMVIVVSDLDSFRYSYFACIVIVVTDVDVHSDERFHLDHLDRHRPYRFRYRGARR